jgi:hypothetical protein
MSEFMSWVRVNWQEMGALLTQVAFLVAGVWFARNILRTMMAFQEHMGALLRLSITATPTEPNPGEAKAKRSLAEASPYWLAPSETQTVTAPESIESGRSRFSVAWHRLGLWLQEPMNASEATSEASPWRRVIHWLQAPAGH